MPGSKRTLIALSLILMLLAGVAAYNACGFFAYADRPLKSDAIILFNGPGFMAREKEALRLLDEGYARFLIVPAFQLVFTPENIPSQVSAASSGANLKQFETYSRFCEKTHIEILQAQEIMNAMKLRSAIMVSSPYHMRRIRVISQKVFGSQSRSFSYVPTRYQHRPVGLLEMDRNYWRLVILESIKICWFRFTSFFTGSC